MRGFFLGGGITFWTLHKVLQVENGEANYTRSTTGVLRLQNIALNFIVKNDVCCDLEIWLTVQLIHRICPPPPAQLLLLLCCS